MKHYHTLVKNHHKTRRWVSRILPKPLYPRVLEVTDPNISYFLNNRESLTHLYHFESHIVNIQNEFQNDYSSALEKLEDYAHNYPTERLNPEDSMQWLTLEQRRRCKKSFSKGKFNPRQPQPLEGVTIDYYEKIKTPEITCVSEINSVRLARYLLTATTFNHYVFYTNSKNTVKNLPEITFNEAVSPKNQDVFYYGQYLKSHD